MPALTVVASARVSKTDSDVNGLHMTHAAPLHSPPRLPRMVAS